jgi:type II secretory pathway component GspD/PulD (secretin)
MMRIPRSGSWLLAAALLTMWALVFPACKGTQEETPTDVEERGYDEPARELTEAERAEELLETTRQLQELRAQKNRILVDNYLDTAREYRDRGDLEMAWESVLRALEVDASDPQAVELYNEIGHLLGRTPETTEDIKRILAERHAVARQAQRAEAERRYERGLELMQENDYGAAILEFEAVLSIIKWNPYVDDSYDLLHEEAQAKLEEAKRGQRRAEKEREEALARDVYRDMKREEARVEEQRAERIRTLLDEGFERFDRGEYDEAEALADRVLEIAPNHSAAVELKESSREARHGAISHEIIAKKQERFVRWMEAIREAKIPSHEILNWPSAKHWEEITRKRKGAEIGEDVEADSPEVTRIKNQLESYRVNLEFEDAPLDAVIEYLRSITGINIVIDPEVKTELEASGTTVRLKLMDIPVGDALEILLANEVDLTYTFHDDVLLVTKKSKAFGNPIPRFHDIRDIAFGLTRFKSPDIRLQTGQAELDEPIPMTGSVEAQEPVISPDDILQLVRTNIAPETWDGNPGTIDITGGRLLVVHTMPIQREVTKFLNDLRKFHGSSVTVEARFLAVRDTFLQDIGVDFRGLGGEKGTLADLDDVTNGLEDNASAGFDNSGPGLPGAAGASPSSGAFYNKMNGDARGRTENIFDNALGTLLSSTGGLSLQWAYLDDTELNLVLRMVEKTDKASVLTAPILTAYDTQRSSIHVINQITYIEDYEVEVAQTAFIADPVVGVIQDGIVFDVRPTISNDRKYVTLEMEPTVADLKTPIPTFTTNLGGLSFPVTIEIPELNISKAGTRVIVPDGGSVVMGGLKRIRSVDRKSETPILSDLPLVGFLFSRRGKSEEIEDLILIVTVHINDMLEGERKLAGM